MAETAQPGAGRARTDEILTQLCGEVLLQGPPPIRQPPVVRGGAAVGLELLDLLLNPDHVLRVTERLTLRNSVKLGRRVTVDVSLDRLSRQQEDAVAQLSALVSDRVGLDDAGPARGERLWLPLDTVPRPVAVSIDVTATDGTILPRPPQREVHRALEAALYQVMRESLRNHPDFDVGGTPVNLMMRRDDAARWTMQGTLLSVSTVAPGAPRQAQRTGAVRRLLPDVDLDRASGDELHRALTALAAAAAGAHQRRALLVVRDALAGNRPFLELVGLVQQHYFVVVGLDGSIRDHSVQFALPDSEALDGSVIKRLGRRTFRTFDPREHNYTVHVQVPLPDNVPQYHLPVSTETVAGAHDHNEVSLIGVVHFDDHPGRPAIDALLTCAEELDPERPGVLGGPAPAAPGDAPPGDEPPGGQLSVGFVARRAAATIDRLDAIVARQQVAANDLRDRWGRASTWTVQQSVRELRRVTEGACRALDRARADLEAAASCPGPAEEASDRRSRAAASLRDAAGKVGHPLLRTRLVSNELAGQDVARITLDEAVMRTRRGPRPRMLEVWATISDEAVPYGYNALGPSLAVAALIYLTGRLLFDTWLWVWPPHSLRLPAVTLDTGASDAIVAVLLLVPAFAVTQFGVPDRWSVAGRLRRPARLFVMWEIATLGVTAMVVATQVGSGDPASADGHPYLVLWVFRAALAVFVAWSAAASLAWGLRRRYAWRPKGLKLHFGAETFARPPARGRGRRWWWPGRRPGWLVRALERIRYDNKAPDAEFDLTLATRAFPSHGEGS